MVYISIFLFTIINKTADENLHLNTIIVSVLPLIMISSSEDIFHNVKPLIRFISIIISATILLNFSKIPLPSVELFFLNFLLEVEFMKFFFFILCITSLSNGMNIIDGTNGLLGFTALFQILSLTFLAFTVNDFNVINLCIIILLPLMVYLFFNFPFGKIFAGDTGAYFFGFIIGFSVILFFGKHPELNSWNAVLILFYPIFELIFSFFRKILYKKSPFEPDPYHLHLKIFFYFDGKYKLKKLANNLTTVSLSCLWLLPILILPFVYKNTVLILFSILILIIIYLLIYLNIPKLNKRKKY